jgi:cytochrome bd-type quinol oxidase subunit 1
MGEVQKPSNANCNTPPLERFATDFYTAVLDFCASAEILHVFISAISVIL